MTAGAAGLLVLEALDVYLTDFGTDAVLAGAPVRAVLDTQTVDVSGVATQEPSALVKTSVTPGAQPGDAFVADGTTYVIRELVREPPDGVFTRIYLAR